ncbi:MAG TPA: DNA starvation/stationary phase protection protein [Flavobacterium sp.]|jgi:starvation-inducible DNA-binding protein
MKPNIGITKENLKLITDLLSVTLANEVTLYTKIRKFHWNVSGESFMELHKLFEEHYSQLEKSIDEIAERISKLGGKAIGTMAEFLQLTIIKENPGIFPDAKDMIRELLEDHETVIIALREDIIICDKEYGDMGTTDFLTDLMGQHETIAWTLRRYLN